MMVLDQSARPPNSSGQQEAYDITAGGCFHVCLEFGGPGGRKGVEYE